MSLILVTASRFLMPLLLLFSVFLVARGHNAPGGGFSAGLVAAGGYALFMAAHGLAATVQLLRISPRSLIGVGLLTALSSAVLPIALGLPLLSGVWAQLRLPVIGKLGSPILFDFGVYLLVTGATLAIVMSIMERE